MSLSQSCFFQPWIISSKGCLSPLTTIALIQTRSASSSPTTRLRDLIPRDAGEKSGSKSSLSENELEKFAGLLQNIPMKDAHNLNIDKLKTGLPSELQPIVSDISNRVQWTKYMDYKLSKDKGNDKDRDKIKGGGEKQAQFHRSHYKAIISVIQDSKTDKEAWEVMQRDVFRPMIKISKTSKISESTELNPKQIRKGKTTRPLKQSEKSTFTNYPKILSDSARFLREFFPGSEYLFQILPKVKEIGLPSYTAGASTDLFNELIKGTWSTYGDFRPVGALLDEMNQNEISFNWETHEILQSIVEKISEARQDQSEIVRAIANHVIYTEAQNQATSWMSYLKEKVELDHLRGVKTLFNDIQSNT